MIIAKQVSLKSRQQRHKILKSSIKNYKENIIGLTQEEIMTAVNRQYNIRHEISE